MKHTRWNTPFLPFGTNVPLFLSFAKMKRKCYQIHYKYYIEDRSKIYWLQISSLKWKRKSNGKTEKNALVFYDWVALILCTWQRTIVRRLRSWVRSRRTQSLKYSLFLRSSVRVVWRGATATDLWHGRFICHTCRSITKKGDQKMSQES